MVMESKVLTQFHVLFQILHGRTEDEEKKVRTVSRLGFKPKTSQI
jgi:hypothetical protein